MNPITKHDRLPAALVAGMLLFWMHGAAADGQNCTLTRLAVLPITLLPDGAATVPVTIAGTERPFVLQIDQAHSAVVAHLADDLKMKKHYLPEHVAISVSGQRISQEAEVSDLKIGVVHAATSSMLLLPQPLKENTLGILGLDILSRFNVEVDLKGRKLNIFSPGHCTGDGVYWADDYAKLPFKTDAIGHITFDMTLDGKPVRAGLSTIRPHGYMGMRDAGDLFGIDAASPGMTVSPVPAEDSKEVNYRYPFKTLSLGGVTVNNPTIDIRPQTRNQVCKAVPHFGTAECYGGSQVNLGLSELTALRLYFAFDEKVLYATAADAHR